MQIKATRIDGQGEMTLQGKPQELEQSLTPTLKTSLDLKPLQSSVVPHTAPDRKLEVMILDDLNITIKSKGSTEAYLDKASFLFQDEKCKSLQPNPDQV